MNRSGLEQSVVRTGLWPVSWAEEVGKREEKKNKNKESYIFCCCCWWLRSGGGRLHMRQPWTQKMDQTIAWKQAERGNCMVCFRAYLITVKLKWKKRENGDVVRRRREEEPEWGIKKNPWGSEQLKNNGIQVFSEDKTAALIQRSPINFMWKTQGGNQLPGLGGWGLERYIIHALWWRNWRTGFAVA